MTKSLFPLVRPLIFAFDAERAHGMTITGLAAWGQAGAPLRQNAAAYPRLACTVAGLRFANPVGLAAGVDKDARAIGGLFGLGFGAVEVGTLTPLPQPGNPRPRLFRLAEDRAVINRMGFNNGGLAAALARVRALGKRPGLLGINVGANKDAADRIADYVAGVTAAAPLADYVTINISSPNTPGLRDLQHGAALAELLAACVAARAGTPLFLKVAPDLDATAIDGIARAAIEAGVDALIVGNTTLSRDGLRSTRAGEAGGLSGAPLAPLATQRLTDFRAATGGKLPLVAVGGIASAAEAYARIRAGASLVQLYTALVYEGPGLVARMLRELDACLARTGSRASARRSARDACASRPCRYGLRPMIRLLLALAVLALPAAAAARTRPAAPKSQGGVVSAADRRAAAAGAEILRAGGSATDAAIATMLALNVVEPQSSGIGGGSFWVSHAAGGTVSTIDAREAAPMAADPRWFYAADGTPLPHDQAVPGGRSVGVPGALRGMALAHRQSGRLPWARLFGPAIRLARDGFRATPRLVNGMAAYGGHVTAETRALYSRPDGTPIAAGDLVRNPAQAALLERIAKLGPDSFYVGPEATKIVATVNGAARNPSKMTAGDLASYDAKPRPPVCLTYRVYKVCGMGPPSSGGITVLIILKQLERFDMAKLGKDSPTAWHLFAESSRLAYADRDLYVGDPDFVQVPVAGMLDPAYLAKRSALISPTASMASIAAGTPAGAPVRTPAVVRETPGTTDLAVVDRRGNVVEVTTTVEGYFGSGLTVDGIVLNNQLTDFDIVPDARGFLAANRVEGGKRPRSSMAPTIVYNPDGSVRLAIGAAGGSTIIAQVAKALVGVLDWKLSAQDAIALGLVYAPGPVAAAEQGTQAEAMAPALRAIGETVRVIPLGLKANAVERVGGKWVGAADPRSEGVWMREDGTATEPPRAAVARAPE